MLVKLFGSDARVKVLSLFLLNAGSEYYLREIAQKTGLAVRSVQRAVGGLVEIEILKRSGFEVATLGKHYRKYKDGHFYTRHYLLDSIGTVVGSCRDSDGPSGEL